MRNLVGEETPVKSRRATTQSMGRGWNLIKRLIQMGVLAAIVGFALIQFVPYGRDHTNPPVVAEPQWDSPRTRQLAAQTCFACHSNRVAWPWYANGAPASWLVQRHVDQGRAALNYSEWDANRPPRRARQAAGTVREGTPPPSIYLWLHPAARLSAAEKEELVLGLTATFGAERSSTTDNDHYAVMMHVAQIARQLSTGD